VPLVVVQALDLAAGLPAVQAVLQLDQFRQVLLVQLRSSLLVV
jgi:hypothetical protein